MKHNKGFKALAKIVAIELIALAILESSGVYTMANTNKLGDIETTTEAETNEQEGSPEGQEGSPEGQEGSPEGQEGSQNESSETNKEQQESSNQDEGISDDIQSGNGESEESEGSQNELSEITSEQQESDIVDDEVSEGTQSENTEANETEVSETETNETEVNETEVSETETNETEANETETNETEANETETNETETNETEVNETEVNETEVDETETIEIIEVIAEEMLADATVNESNNVATKNITYDTLVLDGVKYPVVTYNIEITGINDTIAFPVEIISESNKQWKVYDGQDEQFRLAINDNSEQSLIEVVNANEVTEISKATIKLNDVPRDNNAQFYSYYTLSYSIIPRDLNALRDIHNTNIKEGKTVVNTKITLDNLGITDMNISAEVTTSYMNSELITEPSVNNKYLATYKLKVNTAKAKLNDGNSMLLKVDLSESFRLLPETIEIKLNGEITKDIALNVTSNTFELDINDEQDVEITYSSRIVAPLGTTTNITNKSSLYKETDIIDTIELIKNDIQIKATSNTENYTGGISAYAYDSTNYNNAISGVTFRLESLNNGDNEWQVVKDKDNNDVTGTTDENGKVQFKGTDEQDGWHLELSKKYRLVAIDTTNIYIVDNKNTEFTLVNNVLANGEYLSTDIINISNTKELFRLIVKDKDNGNTLKGSVMKLSGTDTNIELVTNDRGIVQFGKLASGIYTLTETTYPKGYLESNNVYEIVISDTKEVKSNTDSLIIISDNNTYSGEILNKAGKGKLVIVKKFKGDKLDKITDSQKGDITFNIKSDNEVVKSIQYKEFTNGEYILNDFPIGTYSIEETNNKFNDCELEIIGTLDDIVVEDNKLTAVNIENNYNAYSEYVNINTVFKGDEIPSSNKDAIKILIESLDDTGKTTKILETTVKKLAEENNNKVKLPVGKYKVTIKNYKVTGYKHSFNYEVNGESVENLDIEVIDGKELTLTIYNTYVQEFGSLNIEKLFKGETLKDSQKNNVTIVLLDETGDIVENIKYSKMTKGKYNIVKLPVGKYSIKEENYKISDYETVVRYKVNNKVETAKDNKVSFEVLNNQSTNIVIENEYVKDLGKLVLTKTFRGDEIDTESKSKITFKIKGDGKSEYKVTYKEFNNGKYEISLPVGKYTLTEDNKIIDNYKLNTAYKLNGNSESTKLETIEIKADTVTNYEIINEYIKDKGELEITKEFKGSLVRTEDIQNLGFKVYDSNNKEVKSINISDMKENSEGKYVYTVKDLKVGDYTVEEINATLPNYDLNTEFKVSNKGKSIVDQTEGNKVKESVAIKANTKTTVVVTNTYKKYMGSLQILKVFSGDKITESNKGKIKFTIKNSDKEIIQTVLISEMQKEEDGTYSYLTEVPAGNYTVTETNYKVPGFKTKITYKVESNTSDESGTIGVGKDTTTILKIDNNYTAGKGTSLNNSQELGKSETNKVKEETIDGVPKTGDDRMIGLSVLVILISIISLTAIVLYKITDNIERKKKK